MILISLPENHKVVTTKNATFQESTFCNNISNIFLHTCAHFVPTLNKTPAKQPIYQVTPYVNIIYHYRKMDLKSRCNPNLPNCLQVGQKPFVCMWYIQPYDLIKRIFNKNVYSKKVVSAHFQLYDQ